MAIDTLGANALASNSVTTAKIAADAVTSAKIPAGAVVVSDVADGSITTAKLADDAVTTAKVADNAVTNTKVAANAITTESISDATEVLLDATYTNGDATVTVSSTSSLSVGMNIKMSFKSRNVASGDIMPKVGLKIASITNSTTFEMSAAAGQSGTDIPTQFTTGVTTDKLAEHVITNTKADPTDVQLAPYWVNLEYSQNGNTGHTFITNYGTKISASNGNNGPSAIAKVQGSTGHGDFLIRWVPGYFWGFSGIRVGDMAGSPHLGQPGAGATQNQPAGFVYYQFLNNSSNNVRYITKWDGSSANTLQNASSGTNGAEWSMWRINGVTKVNDSVSTTTLQASGDTRDYYFSCNGQGPMSCELKEAYRLTRGGA